jgi:hypothetical protein
MRRDLFLRAWNAGSWDELSAEDQGHTTRDIYEALQARRRHRQLLAAMGQLRRTHPDPVHFFHQFQSQHDCTLRSLASLHNVPPVIMARLVLRGYLSNTRPDAQPDGADQGSATKVSGLLRNPTLISDPQLRMEVERALRNDTEHGPDADLCRQRLGEEGEEGVRRWLHKQGVPFLEERQARQQGVPKTPDFRLLFPTAVKYSNWESTSDDVHHHDPKDELSGHDYGDGDDSWITICWIESKATFGDPMTDAKYQAEQFVPYWTRFGPGLVIYWFDFVLPDDGHNEDEDGCQESDQMNSRGLESTQGPRDCLVYRANRLPDSVEQLQVVK